MLKYLKQISKGLLVLGLLVLVSCEEAVDDDLTSVLESDIIGSWEMVGVEYLTEVTTSLDQRVLLMFSPGTGAISVSGDLSASLTYLFAMDWGQYYSIAVGNQTLGGGSLPAYTLAVIISSSGVTQSLSLDVTLADSTVHTFETHQFEATYDPAKITIKLSELTLMNEDSSLTITLGGELQMAQVQIPANQSTQFNMAEGLSLESIGSSSTMVFSDDNQVHLTNIFGGDDTTSRYSQWAITGDELSLTSDNYGEIRTQVSFVTVEGDELTLTYSENCAESTDESQCLSDMEGRFSFETGSLVEFSEIQVAYYSKTTDTP